LSNIIAPDKNAKVEIRRNPDGSLDEIVASGAAVHLEQMDHDEWCLIVNNVRVFLCSRDGITATVDVDE